MQVALYVALGIFVVAALGMQIWILSTSVKNRTGGGTIFLRVLNIVLILGVVVLVVYALTAK
jgi:hypothetical protein